MYPGLVWRQKCEFTNSLGDWRRICASTHEGDAKIAAAVTASAAADDLDRLVEELEEVLNIFFVVYDFSRDELGLSRTL